MPELLNFREVGPQGVSHDQLTIDTPEQVSIRFPVAGIGSRFLAALTDSLVQGVAYIVLFLLFALIVNSAAKATGDNGFSRNGDKWFIAGLIFIHFLMYWGYFTLFETFWNGQTPGKKLLKIRVIQLSGRQITFFEAMTRNLIRFVDMLPGFYLVGVIAMLCNRQHQRLGDLAASTLVVHERPSDEPLWSGSAARTFTAAAFEPARPEPFLQRHDEVILPADAVARLSHEDLSVIDRFFSRILDMELDTRARIAERLAGQMAQKMGVPPPSEKPEAYLESIARQMRSHG
ncbi:MAG TPA: RDD family protein [Silvibacterium sp.]|nr:RDD family protein [Silvibacterium sp.]